MERRKDNRNRVLRDGEYQKKDGRYEFRYLDNTGENRSVYSWRLVETDKTPTGKRISPPLRDLEKTIKRDLEDGLVIKKNLSLNMYWQSYIEQRKELKITTLNSYKNLYKHYVSETIGNMPIAEINFSVMKKFFNDLLYSRGLKSGSVNQIYVLLHPVFEAAVRDGNIRTNPVGWAISELKKNRNWHSQKRHALTETQQQAFLNYLLSHKKYKRYYAFFMCLLGTGCRIGEMLGLRWQDIDWDNNVIHINHNLVCIRGNGNTEYHITSPKTKSGVRDIPMLIAVKNALINERSYQTQHGFCECEIDGYSGFIWKSTHEKVPTTATIDRQLYRIIRDYNFDESETAKKEGREPELLPHFSAHNLRHTFCVRLCENESDLKLIQELMGHSSITTTMDVYNESNIQRKKASIKKLENVMKID